RLWATPSASCLWQKPVRAGPRAEPRGYNKGTPPKRAVGSPVHGGSSGVAGGFSPRHQPDKNSAAVSKSETTMSNQSTSADVEERIRGITSGLILEDAARRRDGSTATLDAR